MSITNNQDSTNDYTLLTGWEEVKKSSFFKRVLFDSSEKKIIEITHADGSIKTFSFGFFNEDVSRLFLRDVDTINKGIDSGSYNYHNGISEEFGTLKSVRLYDFIAQEQLVRSATNDFLNKDVQRIIASLL